MKEKEKEKRKFRFEKPNTGIKHSAHWKWVYSSNPGSRLLEGGTNPLHPRLQKLSVVHYLPHTNECSGILSAHMHLNVEIWLELISFDMYCFYYLTKEVEMLWSWLEVGARAPPVLPDEVSAVAEQVLLGGPAQFEGPEVVQAHLGRARLAGIAAKQVMNLKSMKNADRLQNQRDTETSRLACKLQPSHIVLLLLRSGEQNTASGIKQRARVIQILFRRFQSEIRKKQLVSIGGLWHLDSMI